MAAEVSPPPLLQRDDNVVTSDPIPDRPDRQRLRLGADDHRVHRLRRRQVRQRPGAESRTRYRAHRAFERARLRHRHRRTAPLRTHGQRRHQAVAASPDGQPHLHRRLLQRRYNGKDRWNIAALDAKTGELVPGFIPSIGGSGVYALTTSGTSVYAGGLFTQGQRHRTQNLAAFEASNGALLPWAPTTDQQVDAMVMDPAGKDTIIGGRFTQISGNTAMRGLARSGRAAASWTRTGRPPRRSRTEATATSAGQAGIFGLATDATGGLRHRLGFRGGRDGQPGRRVRRRGRHRQDPLGRRLPRGPLRRLLHGQGGLHHEPHPRLRDCRPAPGAAEDHAPLLRSLHGRRARNTRTPACGSKYKDWAGTPAPSAYAWSPDWAVGVTSELGQAGLSITGTGNMISIGGEFRSVNNGQFEGLVRFSTTPPGGAKDKPRLSGDDWVGSATRTTDDAKRVTVTIPANWDRDDLTADVRALPVGHLDARCDHDGGCDLVEASGRRAHRHGGPDRSAAAVHGRREGRRREHRHERRRPRRRRRPAPSRWSRSSAARPSESPAPHPPRCSSPSRERHHSSGPRFPSRTASSN